MKNLVRGGAVFTILSLFGIFIYAQVKTDAALIIANDSRPKIENNISDSNLIINNNDDDDDKKLVKSTASVKARGMSRGSFSASAYCFTGRTATGQAVRRGLIAADPRVLKLGSKVYINAGAWSGVYTVSDTGGAIKGKKIDIWVPGCSEARKFGRRSVEIFAVQ